MNENKKKFFLTSIMILIVLSIITISYFIFNNNDFFYILKWYSMLLLATISGMPITLLIFNNFHDKGYIFAKVIGILLPGFLMWLLSSLHLLKFNFLNSLLCIIIIFIISLIIYRYKNKQPNSKQEIENIIVNFIKIEIIFLLIFIFASYIKCFNPAANNIEKFMDEIRYSKVNKAEVT